jgi:membrane-bound metal-dependent hydrolase YbcI (DUF457 family)
MMDWKTHVALGIVLSAMVFYFLFGKIDLTLIVIAGLAALMPDIDHEMSKGKKILDIIVIAFAALIALPSQSVVLFLAVIGAYFIIYKLLKPKHRGITHTIVACLVFSVLIYFTAGLEFAIAVFIGYFSHLALDRF